MKRKAISAAGFAFLLFFVLGLSGCAPSSSETISERADNKVECEKAGGEYIERTNYFTGYYDGWRCDLSTERGFWN